MTFGPLLINVVGSIQNKAQRHRASETGFAPVMSMLGGISADTVTPAPITEPAPTVTPPIIVQRAPIQTPSPTVIGAAICTPASVILVKNRASWPTAI